MKESYTGKNGETKRLQRDYTTVLYQTVHKNST